MVLEFLKEQTLINLFNHLNINQTVNMEAVEYVLIPFEGNKNSGDPTGLKMYLQATKEIDKETDKIDI